MSKLTPEELVEYERKRVKLVCTDGYTVSGMFHLSSSFDDETDELIFCAEIDTVMVNLEEIKEICEM